MKSVAYYSDLNDRDNNFSDDRFFLQVNCAGHAVYGHSPVVNSSRRDYYLILLERGEIRVENPALPRPMRPGDLFIFQKNSPFAYRAAPGGVSYYWVHFTGKEATALLQNCGLAPNTLYEPGLGEALSRAFLSLFSAFEQRDALSKTERASALLALLLSLGRTLGAREKSGTAASAMAARTTAYIHEHIASPLSVTRLAAREFLSPGRFRELFRLAVGMSPSDYIIRLRINIACDLLRHTPAPVAEIASSVGYTDPRYFSRIFRSRIGLTPQAWRAAQEADGRISTNPCM